jgi:hypothetical protein
MTFHGSSKSCVFFLFIIVCILIILPSLLLDYRATYTSPPAFSILHLASFYRYHAHHVLPCFLLPLRRIIIIITLVMPPP